MGISSSSPSSPPQSQASESVAKAVGGEPQSAPKCKACCACPETKKARDTCLIERGEENCKELIEAHKACMRKLGFEI